MTPRRLVSALALAAMVLFLAAAGTAHAREEHPPGPPVPGHAGEEGHKAPHYHPRDDRAVLVQFIGFTILGLILVRFVFPLLGDALRKRREGIREGLETLERDEAKLHALKSASEKGVQDAERASLDRMQQAVKDGAAMKEQLIVEGDEAARKIAHKAKLEQEIERQKMVLELRNEVVDLSFTAAAGLLRTTVDRETQDKLVNDFLNELATMQRAT
jgi:F-type H+-transporting ATPase subunit b